jgi:hypothetical protein
MGLTSEKNRDNKLMGSKLNVPGQGILVMLVHLVKIIKNNTNK